MVKPARYRFLIIVITLLLNSTIQAQTYTGPYTNLVNRTGQLKAQYMIVDEDTIFNGSFYFVIKQDLKEGHKFIKETYQGNYKDGFKEGKWEYDQFDFNYNVNDIQDEKIQLVYWGTKEVMDAKYKKGIPDGLWSYAFFHVDSNRNQSIEKVGSIHFENGKAFGDFVFKSLKKPFYELEGKFDEIGRLDGEWDLNYSIDTVEIQETRIYDDGFLLSLKKYNKNTGAKIDSITYTEVKAKLESGQEKAIGNYPLLFDDGFLLDSPLLRQQEDGNDLLKRAYEVFLWADLGRGSLIGSNHDFNPGTGRFEYELPEEFIVDLNEMRTNLKSIINRSDELLKNPKFQINFHQSEILSKSEIILKYEKKKAQGILNLVNSRADSLYEHIDQDVYFENIYRRYIDRVDTLYYTFNDIEKHIPIHEHVEKDLTPFYKLEDAIATLNRRSEKAIIDIKTEFEKILQEQRLTALEEDLSLASKTIEEVYTQRPSSLAESVYKNGIEDWTTTKWQQYSNMEDFESKEKEGRYILGELEALVELKPRIDSIEMKIEEVDSAYTEYVFDPYTYSQNIKKRIKKRIYEEVALKYFNALRSNMINEKHSEELPIHVEKIERLQERLIEISDENTRSLEKKLRKNQDFENIEKWLELDT